MGEEAVSGYDLATVVKADIESKLLFLQKSIPSDFAFTIHDDDDPRDGGTKNSWMKLREYGRRSDYAIGLTREFEGERIKLFVKESERDCGYGYGYENYGGRKKSGADNPQTLKLVVEISKGNGKKLSFDLTASADEITVGSMTVKVPTYDSDDHYRRSNTEPCTWSVDKHSDLQGVLREFLKIRGIKKSTTDFLFKYMDRKSKRQPMIVLKNLQQFIKD